MTDKQDYSKFRLKSESGLSKLIEGKDNFIILACNKCFKPFTADSQPEPEAAALASLIKKQQKKVSVIINTDFLCNEHRLIRIIDSIKEQNCVPSAENSSVIFAVACGIGAQTAAGMVYDKMPGARVYTACDSFRPLEGCHGMALTDKTCAACGQCRLIEGHCPFTECPKNLRSGPCGGAANGKCETDNNKDCIYTKSFAYKRPACGTPDNAKQFDISIYDHRYKQLKQTGYGEKPEDIAKSIRGRRRESFYGGVYLRYSKEYTANLTLKEFPPPCRVIIPMSQHAGNSAEPIIRVGEYVMAGQKIGEAIGAVSSSVHASVSGTVTEIAYRSHPNTIQNVMCVTIESDGKNTLHKSVKPIDYWNELDIFDIDAIIAEKGIVGMGGAGFPTPVKLKAPKPIDTILINGCESEPYITADHKIMLEKAHDIVKGLQIVMKSTGAERGIIVISDNKSDAIKHLETVTEHTDDIFVMALWSKYPQGAERMLIARALGRHLAYGQRPYDVGAIVINVSTARAIGDAFISGMPLIERAVTVSGERVQRPGNYMVRIGTPVSDIISHCGIRDGGQLTVKLGGPMMGVETDDYSIPIIKGTNAIIINDKLEKCSDDCIKCGRCVDVCPMELLPLHFPLLAAQKKQKSGTDKETDPEKDAKNCIECGACDYICPSGTGIRRAVRELKQLCYQ